MFSLHSVKFGYALIMMVLIGVSYPAIGVPNKFSMEAFITITGADNKPKPLGGIYDVTFELLKPDDTVVFTKKYLTIISVGVLNVSIEDADKLDINLFKSDILKARIKIQGSQIDSVKQLNMGPTSFTGTEVINLPIHSLSRTILSQTSIKTKSFLNENLIKLHEPSLNVSIGTTNIQSRLHVGGGLKANALIGDGSNLLGLDYIRWTRELDPERIHYSVGHVGIGTVYPQAQLHVSGNLLITRNQQVTTVANDPLLIIRNALEADFKGESPYVSNLNANHFVTGHINTERLSGNYPFIKRLGELTSATWNSTTTILSDQYVKNDLTILSSFITNPTIKGTLSMMQPLSVASNSNNHPLKIKTSSWLLDDSSYVNSLKTTSFTIGLGAIEYTSTFNLKTTNGTTFLMNPDGLFAYQNQAFIGHFNPSQSIRVGNSNHKVSGLLRLNEFFEGYVNNKWRRLDKSGIFTGVSLFPENNIRSPVITISSSGLVGINDKKPKDAFNVSGNVVMLGNPSARTIAYIPTGNHFIWNAKKGALRIGENTNVYGTALGLTLSSMYTSANVGKYSIGLGKNTVAKGENSVIVGTTSENILTTVTGENSIIIVSPTSKLDHSDTIVMASRSHSNINSNAILFSTQGRGSDFTGMNNIVLNGYGPSSVYNNAIFGGHRLTPPRGNNSFMWDLDGRATVIPLNSHNTFIIGMNMRVGINATPIPSPNRDIMNVGGGVKSDMFIGSGYYMSGNITVEFLKKKFTTVTKNIYPTFNISKDNIYVSDKNNYLPDNSVSNSTIKNLSIEGNDFESFSIGSDKLLNGSIGGEQFADGSIKTSHLKLDDLEDVLFSNIDSTNIEEKSVDHQKIATNSIYTLHFVDQAVTTQHILANCLNPIKLKTDPNTVEYTALISPKNKKMAHILVTVNTQYGKILLIIFSLFF